MKWIKTNLNLLLSIAFMLMTLTIFGPLELYLTNSSEFWFEFSEMLKISGILTAVAGVVLLVIGLILKGKTRSLYAALVFILALCLYIQGNFLNIDYGILDGKSVDWSSYVGYAVVDTLFWVAVISILVILWKKKAGLFAKIQLFAPIFIMAMQILTLGTLLVFSNILAPAEEGNHYLSTENIFNIGEKDSIVVFVLDAFDGGYMEEIFEEEPEKYETIFEDFTYYTNVAAGGATTYSAMPIIITGENYPGKISYDEYTRTSFNSDNLYTELTKAGYSVNLYTESDFVPYAAAEYVDNLVTDGYRVNSYLGITQKYGSLTAYKYMPHLLKQFFWIYTGDFNQYKSGGSTGAAAYTSDDVWFYETLVSDHLTKIPGKTFNLIHTTGSHPPYNINEFAQREDNVSIMEKSRGQLYIIEGYLREMKELGVYDNSTVIITSDHGQEILPRSTLLIKRPHETGFKRNDAPISHFDLHNTYFELIGKETGDSIFDIKENVTRTRMYYPQSSENGTFFMTEHAISGNPKDRSNCVATGVVLAPTKQQRNYTFGEQLTFGTDGTVNAFVEKGVSTLHVGYSWTDGNEILFKFQLDEAPQKDLALSLTYYTVYLNINDQYLGIYVDDTLLFEGVLQNPDTRTITVDIPAELAADKELVLKLALPDAKCPAEVLGPGNDPHTLGLALTGLSIEEIDLSDTTAYTFGDRLTFGPDATIVEYVEQGISDHNQQEFAWTAGHDVLFRVPFKYIPSTDLQVTLNAGSVFTDYGPQRVQIYAGNTLCYDNTLTKNGDIRFTVRTADLTDNALMLRLRLPNAVSPYSVTGEGDRRILGLALTGLTIEELDFSNITPYTFGERLTFGVDATVTGYVNQGVSTHDTQPFAWTNSQDVLFALPFKYIPVTDLQVTLNASGIFTEFGPQQVKIYAGNTLCYDSILEKGGDISFTVPKTDLVDNALVLRISLPDAVSPYTVTGEGDRRTLGLALAGLCIEPVSGTIAELQEQDPSIYQKSEPIEAVVETVPEDTAEEPSSFSIVDIVAVPLTAVMMFCHNLLGNYILAILVFTLLTKIILLPISMWVHKSGITMVRITPELNRVKIKHYGDRDAIDDATQALYKREKYNPLASTVPMVVQIVMLLGVIGAVKNLLINADSALTLVPSEAGGITYLMPLAAGAAALALGLAQNRLSPLQREQGRREQWMSNGFSIAISLFLGAFVSLGVGVYWIASNLLSIAQQMLLNVLIKPEKHIDYAALEESKKELASLDSLSAEVSKEDKKREQEDYKRFFSVANKHLVFYSEKSGFYKYYKDVMDFMLKYSNVVIHYVTNDPKDQVFKLAEEQPRIRPYYISEKRLITLLMKMDADIVVMTCPDLDRFHLKRSYVRKDIEYVYMFHYPLSTHMVLNNGALDHYDTILCVGDFQFEEIRAAEKLYNLPEKKLISTGYGQLEQLYASYQKMKKIKREKPKILIAPSWQQDNILDSCIDLLLEQLLGKGYELVIRPHPEYVKRYKPRMDAIVQKYSHHSDLTFELDFTSNNSLFDSDILISDWSGSAYEFSLVTLKPAVFINTPPKINNPEYSKLNVEPLEFKLRGEVGIQIDPNHMENMAEKINDLVHSSEAYAEKIQQIRDKYMANFGRSGEVGGKYILGQLLERQNKKGTRGEV